MRLLIGGPAALWLVMLGRIEEQIVARQIRCRSDVRERCEQRRKICHRHHLGELLVGARELDWLFWLDAGSGWEAMVRTVGGR